MTGAERSSGADQRLFHLVEPVQWLAADVRKTWAPASLASDGFVHLSFARQLRGTLEVHFARYNELWLLEIARDAIAADLRLEASRGGEPFPHLYRGLACDEILGWWCLGRDAARAWRLPHLATQSIEDDPPRTPGRPR